MSPYPSFPPQFGPISFWLSVWFINEWNHIFVWCVCLQFNWSFSWHLYCGLYISGLPAASSSTAAQLGPCHHLFFQFINAFPGSVHPREIGPNHLTSIPASLIDVFQSPSPCWVAIVNCLAALTLPSGPCRGAWAQLDSPIVILQIQQPTGATQSVKFSVIGATNSERHVITVIMMLIVAAYLMSLRAANGAVGANKNYTLLQVWYGTS